MAFIATCPPRACGLATFTSDLVTALRTIDPCIDIHWAAIERERDGYAYGPEVRWRIRQRHPTSYLEVARQLNQSPVDVVNLQHEFGLYGIWGDHFEDHVVPLLEALDKPLVTTFHTVPSRPSPSVLRAVRTLAGTSYGVVVMTEAARRTLTDTYLVTGERVSVIPHGTPTFRNQDRDEAKRRFDLGGRQVLLTIGLVDPRKGLEYMVRAMPHVVRRSPAAVYVIAGITHPDLVLTEGEAYRERLERLVRELTLQDHIRFVNEYLPDTQLADLLTASDVYITPYLDPDQATSGTLSYALAAGKAIVSTRYVHAVEALDSGRGLLVDFRDERQLAAAVLRVACDPGLASGLERAASAFAEGTAWPSVARSLRTVLVSASAERTSQS